MMRGSWSGASASRGLVLVIVVMFSAAGVYASSAAAATRAKKARLTVSWPGTGFPGYKLAINGRASGWGPGALLVTLRYAG
jgi:hypothetical protein